RTGKELDLSTRLHVETGQHVGIAGFIINGSASKKVIVRALGPTLAQFGVSGVLQDPVLDLYDSSKSLVASNDNWKSSKQTEIQASGYAPGDNREAAIIQTLAPGNYSAVLQDPEMDLFDGNGNLIASNDNWKALQQTAIQATGLAPADEREPAILTTLIQGNWTAIVRGKNNTTGVGLIEVYRIQ